MESGGIVLIVILLGVIAWNQKKFYIQLNKKLDKFESELKKDE